MGADPVTELMVYTPTWRTADGGTAMLPECQAAIEAQEFELGVRVCRVIGLENPYPIPDGRNVYHQYVQGRRLFLESEAQALLFVEHDNVLPDPGAVQRMLATAADVVYAPYMLRHGAAVLSLWQYIGDRNIGESLTLHRDELAKARQSITWRVSGVGFGCTLIRRHVLEQIEFQVSDQAPDMPFAADCLRRGFLALARMDVPVLHWQSGRWLHPWQGKGAGAMKTYIAQATMNALVMGREVHLVEGEPIELSDEEAQDLIRAGYVSGPVPPEEERGDRAPTKKTRKAP